MTHNSGCGIDKLIEGPIKTLLDAGIELKLSIDGDVKLMSKFSKIKNIDVHHDMAHLKKNIVKFVNTILKHANFLGDSDKKIGKENLVDLNFGIKTAYVECAAGAREHQWTRDDVKKRLTASIDHHKGSFSNVMFNDIFICRRPFKLCRKGQMQKTTRHERPHEAFFRFSGR